MKDYRQANKGKPFEDFLKFVHMQYQNTGIACVHKVPTEFIPIRDYKGKIVSCKVKKKAVLIISEDINQYLLLLKQSMNQDPALTFIE